MALRKIKNISQAQRDALPMAREKWLREGLSTSPADRDAAGRAVVAMYAEIGESRPLVFWVESPLRALMASSWLRALGLFGPQLRSQLELRLGPRLVSQLDSQLGLEVDSELGLRLDSQLDSPLRSELDSQLRSQLDPALYSELYSELYLPLGSQLRTQLGTRLRSQLGSQVTSHLNSRLDSQRSAPRDSPLDSQLDSRVSGVVSQWWSPLWAIAWGAFYTFAQEWGVEYEKRSLCKLRCVFEWALSGAWMWPLRGAAVLTERPAVLERDHAGNLHCETGPAVAYRDGWELWAIHGVRVTENVVDQLRALTVEHIQRERNAEARRVMLDRFGWERYLRESKAELLDEVHEPPFPGLMNARLWRSEVRHDERVIVRREVRGDEPLVVLECQNSTRGRDGSVHRFFIRVPPWIERAHEAAAWTFQMDESEYRPLIES